MRYPFGAQWSDDVFNPATIPQPGIAFQRIRAVPYELIEQHFSYSMP